LNTYKKYWIEITMGRIQQNNILILGALLVLILIIAWLATRNPEKEEMTTHTTHLNATKLDGEMPVNAVAEPNIDAGDYEILYGQGQDGFGIGPGTSLKTTNEWSLL